MRNHFLIYISGLLILLSGCAHSVHEYEVSDFEFQVGEKVTEVKSDGEQQVIMGFAFDTNYVESALNKLKKKCPNQKISGINARYSTSLGFYSWVNKVHLKGFCHN
jgi:hypothetical protein